MKAASFARKELFQPAGLLTEAGYTEALVALATEVKAKREAKAALAASQNSQQASSAGFTLTSDDARKASFVKERDRTE